MVLVLGAGLTVCGFWPEQIKKATSHGVLRIIKWLILIGLAIIMCITGFLAYQGSVDEVTYEEDAIVGLGAAVHGDKPSSVLKARLNGAVEYAGKNPEALIIVSGGQGPQENLSEAEVMASYLIEKGIPENRIIKEDQATSTYENFVYSKAILDERFEEGYTCAYVTNEFHCYRAGIMAGQVGLDVNGISVKTEWWKLPVNYMRESLAVAKLWVFDM